jgi:hypothetical protein
MNKYKVMVSDIDRQVEDSAREHDQLWQDDDRIYLTYLVSLGPLGDGLFPNRTWESPGPLTHYWQAQRPGPHQAF